MDAVNRIETSWYVYYGEVWFQWLEAGTLVWLLLYQATWALRGQPLKGPVGILHEGISETETYADPERTLSACWLVDRGLTNQLGIKYVLRFPPKEPHPDYIVLERMLEGMGWRTALRAAGHAFGMLVKGLW